jgi:hypothetical protein
LTQLHYAVFAVRVKGGNEMFAVLRRIPPEGGVLVQSQVIVAPPFRQSLEMKKGGLSAANFESGDSGRHRELKPKFINKFNACIKKSFCI